MAQKKILIISYSPLERDPRVLRQIEALGKGNTIVTAGLSSSQHIYESRFVLLSVHYIKHLKKPILQRKLTSLIYVIPIRIIRKVRKALFLNIFKNYELYYWNSFRKSALRKLLSLKFDTVIANDIDVLPFAVEMKKKHGSFVYFDAHEYSPLQYENNPEWLRTKSPFFTFLCEKYVPLSDYCTTVSGHIAQKYEKLTAKKFEVLYNAPKYERLQPTEPIGSKIRCVHHGISSPMRNLDSLILAFKDMPKQYELHLFLVPQDDGYLPFLKELSVGNENIIFHDPVPTTEIPTHINQFDVSLIFIPPISFNYKYCLPNKFFESIQGRLMILTGPSLEMQLLVDEHHLGKVAEGFGPADIRKAVLALTLEEISEYKRSVDKAAQLLCSEVSTNKLIANILQS